MKKDTTTKTVSYCPPECGPMDFYDESGVLCASGGERPAWPEEDIIQ